MKALVTGSKGFVGTHLTKHLESLNYEVVGFNMRDGQDLRNYEQIRNILDIERPNVIFHIAAQAAPAESFLNPQRTFEVNTIGSLNLLEAVRQLGLKVKIHMAGTSEEYGPSEPIAGVEMEPRSPYAISKLAMDQLAKLYVRAYGLHIVVTRAFNHTGPGRGEMYAEAAFAKQIAEIEVGKRKILNHGNLQAIRNYTDVRDIVRAYELAVHLESGAYNICSDRNVDIKEVLECLIDDSTSKIFLEKSSSLLRPADFDFKEPNCDKFRGLTGWNPQIPLEITLLDILNEWRGKV